MSLVLNNGSKILSYSGHLFDIPISLIDEKENCLNLKCIKIAFHNQGKLIGFLDDKLNNIEINTILKNIFDYFPKNHREYIELVQDFHRWDD